MPLVAANGIQLYYEEHGHGEPLLLMAPTGWPGSVWDLEQVSFFAPHFRVITYDQRGIGLSDQPDEEYTTDLLADDALALLHAVGAVPAHVLGFSMGGRIAQLMAIKEASAFRSLVLAGTDAGRSGARAGVPGARAGVPLDVALSLGEHGYAGYFADHLEHDFPFSPEFRAQHPEKVQALANTIWARRPPLKLYLRHILARGGHDAVDRLGAIRAPTLVMVGGEDRFSRGGSDHVESARALAGAIPGAQLALVNGARHLFPWEAPAHTNTCLLEFFRRYSM